MVSRLTGGQEAAGSSPVTRTKKALAAKAGAFFLSAATEPAASWRRRRVKSAAAGWAGASRHTRRFKSCHSDQKSTCCKSRCFFLWCADHFFFPKKKWSAGKAVPGREVPEPVSFWTGPKRNGFGLPKKKALSKDWERVRLLPAPGNDVKKWGVLLPASGGTGWCFRDPSGPLWGALRGQASGRENAAVQMPPQAPRRGAVLLRKPHSGRA